MPRLWSLHACTLETEKKDEEGSHLDYLMVDSTAVGSVAPPGFIWKELHCLSHELGMCLLPDTHSPRSTPSIPASLSPRYSESVQSTGKGSSLEIPFDFPVSQGRHCLWIPAALSRTRIPVTSPPASDLVSSGIPRCRISASALPVTTWHGNYQPKVLARI